MQDMKITELERRSDLAVQLISIFGSILIAITYGTCPCNLLIIKKQHHGGTSPLRIRKRYIFMFLNFQKI